MSYIYDIVLNFNKLYYEFYEWKDSDNLLNFRKIPLFKISNKDYISIKYNDVKVDNSFIGVIYDCSYLVGSSDKIIACLVSNGSEVMGIKLNSDGIVIGKSSLLFDEEDEVLEDIINSKEYNIKYEVINKYSGKKIFSRSVDEKKNYLVSFFNDNNTLDIYKYIYYDFYEEEEKDINKIKKKLLGIFSDDWNNECERLYDNIKLFNRVR